MNWSIRASAMIVAKLCLLLGSLLFVELLFQLASGLNPLVDRYTFPKRPDSLKDAIVGHRGDPSHPGHDERGFRNPVALDRASAVTLGDSHTYGTSVEPEQAWPVLLADFMGASVYNMGFGGYASSHNERHLDLAIGLRPRVVIFCLYFGNDFVEDFLFTLERNELDSFVSSDAIVEVGRLQAESRIEDEVDVLYNLGKRKARATADSTKVAPTFPARLLQAEDDALRWFKASSRVYGLIRNVYFNTLPSSGEGSTAELLAKDFERAANALSPEQLAFASAYAGAEWKTILTAPYRFRVLDDSDPRVRTGIEISKHRIVRMGQHLASEGIEFAAVMLPTKESVFFPRVDTPQEHKDLTKLAVTEARLREEVTRFLREEGILVIDPTQALQQAEAQPYFTDTDGHPNSLGHKVIASVIAAELRTSFSTH